LGLGLLGLIVVALVVERLIRGLAGRSNRIRALGDRLAATPPMAWIRRRFPAQVTWVRRRVDPSAPTGFPLTFALAVAALALWAFAGLAQDVVSNDDSAFRDQGVQAWAVAHRTGWATSAMKAITWLGSSVVLYPLLVIVGAYFLWRHRDWGPGARCAAALVGAVALYDIVKPAVGRARPPADVWIGHYSGFAFPSGHATGSIAFYGMLALVLSARASPKARIALWTAAGLVVLVVGASRIYLGAHWMTDVLAGWALGAGWVALVVAAGLWLSRRSGVRSQSRRRPGPQDEQSQAV
jgi:membrane-associated phospholipid phosphatase